LGCDPCSYGVLYNQFVPGDRPLLDIEDVIEGYLKVQIVPIGRDTWTFDAHVMIWKEAAAAEAPFFRLVQLSIELDQDHDTEIYPLNMMGNEYGPGPYDYRP